jgi:hypothetical protein
VQTAQEQVVRVRRRGRRRQIVPMEAITSSRKRKLDTPMDPATFDPWSEQPDTLPQKTRQLCECSTCQGARTVVCHECMGEALVLCPRCAGSGAVLSPRTGKGINCPSCRGSGQRRCTCRNGTLSCAVCAGKGKVDRWLTIEESLIDVVRVDGSVTLLGLLEHATEPYFFDQPPSDVVACTRPSPTSSTSRHLTSLRALLPGLEESTIRCLPSWSN